MNVEHGDCALPQLEPSLIVQNVGDWSSLNGTSVVFPHGTNLMVNSLYKKANNLLLVGILAKM
jgi:hypothetical protein